MLQSSKHIQQQATGAESHAAYKGASKTTVFCSSNRQ